MPLLPFDRELLGEEYDWKEGDGPILHVHSEKLAGFRCLWSCRWQGKRLGIHGVLMPEAIAPLDSLTPEQAFYELSDIVEWVLDSRLRTTKYENMGMVTEARRLLPDKPYKSLPIKARAFFEEFREHYPEFTSPWLRVDYDKLAFGWVWRPGWEPSK